jgi:AraC-like DNA-binding protein
MWGWNRRVRLRRSCPVQAGEPFVVQGCTMYNNAVLQYFLDITRMYSSTGPHRSECYSALLYILLAELDEIYRYKGEKHDRIILDLLRLMSEYPDRFFTIKDLAETAKMSPKSLSTRFRKEIGQSPHKFQMDRKLERVESLLRIQSYQSLKNLAYDFGSYDEFHLSSSFKRKFGQSPTKYNKT